MSSAASLAFAVSSTFAAFPEAPPPNSVVSRLTTEQQTLFDVPQDGLSVEIYRKRLADADAFLREVRETVDDETFAALNEALRPVCVAASRNLADASELSDDERERHWGDLVDRLTAANDYDALRALLQSEENEIGLISKRLPESPADRDATSSEFAAARVDAVEAAIYEVRFQQFWDDVRRLQPKTDPQTPPPAPTLTPELEATLRTLETAILAKATAGKKRPLDARTSRPFFSSRVERWSEFALQFADALALALPDAAKTFRKELYAVVSSLEAPEDREIAERLQRRLRVDDLLGAEFPVEGVLADGSEIDRASYRGKVVYFAVYNSAFLTNPNGRQSLASSLNAARFAELRDRYGDAGFKILLYDLATSPPKAGTTPGVFGVEPNDILSRALTRAAEKDYADLSALYFSLEFPGTGFIVDVDGKGLDANAPTNDPRSPRRLEAILQERFPEIGDAAQN